MPYVNFWLCVGVVALAAAGTYIFWGPSNRPKRKRKEPVSGLQNLGNSCFLNAVLQALAACPSCVSWLMTVAESLEKRTWDNYPLIKALISIFKALKRNDDFCTAVEVLEALRAHRWLICNEEQDAHELFHVLTTTIEEELNSKTPLLSLFEATELEDDSSSENRILSKEMLISSLKLSKIKNSSPTRGLLVNELKCKVCSCKYPTRYDTFDSISLVIPMPHWGQLSLQDLLQKFISCELVKDVSCDVCTKAQTLTQDVLTPKTKSTFLKQLSFGKLPKCLCIHIQRTMWLNNGIPVKCFDYIIFPEILVMDHYVHCNFKRKNFDTSYPLRRLMGGNCSNEKKQEVNLVSSDTLSTRIVPDEIKKSTSSMQGIDLSSEKQLYSCNFVFLLKAIIVHLGDTSSGHFITYRRGSENRQNQCKWFRVSDTIVKEVTFAEVSQCCAYMLFYEKIN